jgi:hypothetical protein
LGAFVSVLIFLVIWVRGFFFELDWAERGLSWNGSFTFISFRCARFFSSLRSKLVAPHKLRRTLRSHILFSGRKEQRSVGATRSVWSVGASGFVPGPTQALVFNIALSYPVLTLELTGGRFDSVGIVAFPLLFPSSLPPPVSILTFPSFLSPFRLANLSPRLADGPTS